MTEYAFINLTMMFERYSNSFLHDFSLDNLLCKFSNVRFKSFKKGEFIYSENEALNSLYFILSGEVSIGLFSDDNGIRQFANCVSGDIIGIDDALSEKKYTKSAYAVTNVNTIEISKAEFIDLTRKNDEFNLWILKYLSNKINAISS